MNNKPTTILLIRHAMNDYIVARRLAGWTPEVHLNEKGRAQAQALGARLAGTHLAAVYSSPLERTVETAQAIAEPHGLTVICLRAIGESDVGEWTGQSLDELSKTEAWRQVQAAPGSFRFPGGESFAQIQERMVTALEAIVRDHAGQVIAVVSHSDPIKAALAHYLAIPLDAFQRLLISPASISELAFTDDGPRLVRSNDCAHLPEEK